MTDRGRSRRDAAYFPGNRRHAFAGGSADPCVYYLAMTLGEPDDAHHRAGHGGRGNG